MSHLKLQLNILKQKEKGMLGAEHQHYGYFIELNTKKYKIPSLILASGSLLKRVFYNQKINYLVEQSGHNKILKLDSLKCPYQCQEKVFKFFEGQQIKIERNHQSFKFSKILQKLEMGEILQEILRDVQINYNQYSIFSLFLFSKEFNLPSIKQKCLKDFIQNNFEQLNINLYDLLQCDEKSFVNILRIHHSCKQKKSCKGLTDRNIRKIIKQYCEANAVKIIIDLIMSPSLQVIKQDRQGQIDQSRQEYKIFKKTTIQTLITASECSSNQLSELEEEGSKSFCSLTKIQAYKIQ